MTTSTAARTRHETAFTRIELIVVVATLFMLVVVSVARLGRAGVENAAATCLDNHRALAAAWTGYANDHAGLLVNNLSVPETESTITAKTYLNWANDVMSWATTGLDAQTTTNLALVSTSPLFPYLQSNLFAFKCPADSYLSAAQLQAGWQLRIRSYSMNGFMGQQAAHNDLAIKTGKSVYVPTFRQFLQLDSIPEPGGTFVFLDEHPDSINEGLFLNDLSNSTMWFDQPASHHEGGCSFSFADGHVELHQWASDTTKIPVRYSYTRVSIPSTQRVDYNWVTARTAVEPTRLATRLTASNQLQIVWSSLPTNYVLQARASLVSGSWSNVPTASVLSPGQRAATQGVDGAQRYFRLLRQ